MRRIACFILLLTISSVLFAQKDYSSVPGNVRSVFRRDHPNAMVDTWAKEKDNYVVVFREPDSLHHVLVYDKNGSVIRSETQLQENEFPPAIVNYYETHYPDKKRFEIWGSRTPDGAYTFYSNVDDNTLYFDKDGNFIRSDKRTSYVK